MSDNYDNDSFDRGSNKSDSAHNLKLSVDLMSVRNMTQTANVYATY